MTRKLLLLAALLASAALAGCGSSPVTHFYTLNPAAAEPAAAGAGAMAVYIVAVGAVSLPDGVDRPQIVLRTGGNRVSFSEFERWGGALRG